VKRREFIGLIGGAVAWPHATNAQQAKAVPRIGVLWHAGSADEEKEYLLVLRKAFNDLGYVEGKSIQLEHRFPAEQPERYRAFARELVESKVDVIVAVTIDGAIESKKATSTIPIVFVIVADPIGNGLVENLARPGGNITGLSLMVLDVTGKRLALLKEMVPNLSRVAVLLNPGEAVSPRAMTASLNAAKALGLAVERVEVASPDAIEHVFATIARDGFDGALVFGAMMFNERARVSSSALAHKIPAMSVVGEMVEHGLLISYGQDFPDYFRKAAVYVDKILKGAKPTDLPVEQPTRFELVINLKTAKALGLTVPPSLLVTADQIIE
jgi:putative tryptophan/tyrosine transport system substrate-binding protein